jgi:competence protein ComGC
MIIVLVVVVIIIIVVVVNMAVQETHKQHLHFTTVNKLLHTDLWNFESQVADVR